MFLIPQAAHQPLLFADACVLWWKCRTLHRVVHIQANIYLYNIYIKNERFWTASGTAFTFIVQFSFIFYAEPVKCDRIQSYGWNWAVKETVQDKNARSVLLTYVLWITHGYSVQLTLALCSLAPLRCLFPCSHTWMCFRIAMSCLWRKIK